MSLFIFSATRLNPLVTADTPLSDHATIHQGKGTEQENLIEYAGRVCYKSTGNMGHNPDFIAARMKEGHTDITEHVSVTLMVPTDNPVAWALSNRPVAWDDPTRFFMVSPTSTKAGNLLVTANVRAWYVLLDELFHLDPENPFVRHLGVFLPQIFGKSKEPITISLNHLGGHFAQVAPIYSISDEGGPADTARQRVSLLGITPYAQLQDKKFLNHCAATFLVEGVSRSLSHQMVRHRLLSFSQESQRYVDFEKGQWLPVVPPRIAADPTMLGYYLDSFWLSKQAYTLLRTANRKEDARFLLPNATETRFVVSGPLLAWEIFFKQRMDSAAQWEIRGVADKAIKLLIGQKLDYFERYALQ